MTPVTISILFIVSIGYGSTLFGTWIKYLAQGLNPAINWPKKRFWNIELKYPNAPTIIDSTEVPLHELSLQ